MALWRLPVEFRHREVQLVIWWESEHLSAKFSRFPRRQIAKSICHSWLGRSCSKRLYGLCLRLSDGSISAMASWGRIVSCSWTAHCCVQILSGQHVSSLGGMLGEGTTTAHVVAHDEGAARSSRLLSAFKVSSQPLVASLAADPTAQTQFAPLTGEGWGEGERITMPMVSASWERVGVRVKCHLQAGSCVQAGPGFRLSPECPSYAKVSESRYPQGGGRFSHQD